MVTNGPGTESEKPTSGLDNKFDNFDFTKEESEAGYKNFCVIRCNIKSIGMALFGSQRLSEEV